VLQKKESTEHRFQFGNASREHLSQSFPIHTHRFSSTSCSDPIVGTAREPDTVLQIGKSECNAVNRTPTVCRNVGTSQPPPFDVLLYPRNDWQTRYLPDCSQRERSFPTFRQTVGVLFTALHSDFPIWSTVSGSRAVPTMDQSRKCCWNRCV